MPNYKRFYLKDYNYVFITMVTYNRAPILIDNIDLLRQSFKSVLKKYNFRIFSICILKDHIHMILKMDNLNEFSNIISNLKKYFTYNYHNKPLKESLPKSMQKRKEAGIWQRRFYEHIIRNDNDLQKHLDYIHFNPYKHYNILPSSWKYSTFLKFVNMGYYELNWCEFNDDLQYE